ncbi:MAG: class B sortase, partial [Clostridium sp.]|nr:class B sortase [Clostridium sp.]
MGQKEKQLIATLRAKTDFSSLAQLQKVAAYIKKNPAAFRNREGLAFAGEIQDHLNRAKAAENQPDTRKSLDPVVLQELKKRDRRRRMIITLCSLLAAGCLGYFGIYSWFDYRTERNNEQWSELRDQGASGGGQNTVKNPQPTSPPTIHTTERVIPDVLEEYQNLYNSNKKLIGWLQIADTNIDYPVMQTSNNEYYLEHNLNQEYDKNGSIFMDYQCDVIERSTNLIIYGHNMKSGRMFGQLDNYSKKQYYEKHPIISFDTIYEKGTYEIAYVFRSHVYAENEITFKYYQFIDAQSEAHFDSTMQEMAAISLYDTGVTPTYGDQLLTLSTCDNSV